MRIDLYEDHHRADWDAFVSRSKNGTFLFQRDYMDYHRDRFEDCSLIARDNNGRIVALLPANRHGTTIVSHGGLTYGGFVTDAAMKTAAMVELFALTLTRLRADGATTFDYKTMPHIYHHLPAEEDRYALFLADARIKRRGLLTVVMTRDRPSPQDRRVRGAKKAQALNVTVGASDNLDAYWELLTARLLASHGVRPVHSVDEIRSLCARFPKQIRLLAAHAADGEMVAGVVVYESALVAHCQYIAASDRGRELHALDLLFMELLTHHYAQKPFFDFGTSDDADGRQLNRGLVEQKEGFGARAVVHDHYTIDLERCDPERLVRSLV